MISTLVKRSIASPYATTAAVSQLFQTRVLSTLPLADAEEPSSINQCRARNQPKLQYPVPDFNDSRGAFESKTTRELLRAAACFQLCRIPFLVNNADELLRLSRRVLGDHVTDLLLKATLYGHFCAGEDQKRIQPVLGRLDSAGVGSILDYAAESDGTPSRGKIEKSIVDSEVTDTATNSVRNRHQDIAREYDYEDEAQCDRHLEVFRNCIYDAASLSKDSFAAVKVTALGNPKLLARMSQAIVETKNLFKKFDANLDGYVSREEFESAYNVFFKQGKSSLSDIFDEFDPKGTGKIDYITWSLKLKPTDLPNIVRSCKERGPLSMAAPTDEEIELIETMYERGHRLAETATKVGTRLLVDAEQVRFQPAIDSLVLDLQQKFNGMDISDKPIIYNTYQCYLKDAPERLRLDIARSQRFNYHFGAKLVRGAYLESERILAAASNIPSPIHETIEDTHSCYDESLEFLLKSSVELDQRVEVMCASHNQRSIEKAIEAMAKYEINRKSNTVSFGQLYGMSDHLSYNLGKWGYRAYKYVPYGEVHEVVPYLLRRARENSAIVGGTAAELRMINDELRRRLNPFQKATLISTS